MRLIIAGGRDYDLTAEDFARLDGLMATADIITEVVVGGCRGADDGGYRWATRRGIPVRIFPADWKKHGYAAGPIRNGEMARYAAQGNGALAAFPGGKGTSNMVKQAILNDLRVFDFRK